MTYAPFNELRTQVEKQYENVVFVPESGGSETELRRAWENHKNENPAALPVRSPPAGGRSCMKQKMNPIRKGKRYALPRI